MCVRSMLGIMLGVGDLRNGITDVCGNDFDRFYVRCFAFLQIIQKFWHTCIFLCRQFDCYKIKKTS